jgi:hypothetical protein
LQFCSRRQAVPRSRLRPKPVSPPSGPFACTELIGLLSTGEWFDGGFYNALGELKTGWQGRFSHYGYTYEYAKPDSYAWSATNVGGVNSVRLSAPCLQKADAPDRIVYQAWSWELTSEKAWIDSLEAALATIRTKRPECQANRHYDHRPLPAKRMVSFRQAAPWS